MLAPRPWRTRGLRAAWTLSPSEWVRGAPRTGPGRRRAGQSTAPAGLGRPCLRHRHLAWSGSPRGGGALPHVSPWDCPAQAPSLQVLVEAICFLITVRIGTQQQINSTSTSQALFSVSANGIFFHLFHINVSWM